MPDADPKQTTAGLVPSELESRTTLGRTSTHHPEIADSGSIATAGLSARYDDLRVLGQGGMGVVYAGRDRETGALVALKVLRPEIAANPDALERFKGELRLARRVTHKNVCRTHELMRFGDTAVISMEYVEGETLGTFLKRCGGVPLRRGLVWARQMCSALGEAHAQGVVHRDLKPENIQIDLNGDIKVMDFGIARSGDDTGTGGSLIGTPAYMSPEQLSGKPVDARSDLYALGLILFEMFVGRSAFTGDTPMAKALTRLNVPPPDPKEAEPLLPPFLARAIARCLEREPRDRFKSAADLETALSDLPSVPEPEQAEMPAHLTRPGRLDLVLLAMGTLSLVAYLLLWPRVTPGGAVRIRATHAILIDAARAEVARRTGRALERPAWVIKRPSSVSFRSLALALGYDEAQKRLGQDLPPFLFEVNFDNSAGVNPSTVTYDPEGGLRGMSAPPGEWISAEPSLPKPQAAELAVSEIQGAFGVRVDRLETEATLSENGRQGHRFVWVVNEANGLVWRYQADVFDRVVALNKWPTLVDAAKTSPPAPLIRIAFLPAFFVAVGLFVSRKLWDRMERRPATVLAGLSAACGVCLTLDTNSRSPDQAVLMGLLSTLILFVPLLIGTPVLVYLGRRKPHLLTSLLAGLRLRPSRPLGLAVSRGVGLGLVALGIGAAHDRLGIALGYPPTGGGFDTSASSWGIWASSASLLMGTTMVAGLGACLALITQRRIERTSVIALLGSLLALVSVFGEPWNPVNLIHLSLVGALFVVCLFGFDFATVLVAALVSGSVDLAVTVMKVIEPIGNGSAWSVVALWILVLVWGWWFGYEPWWDRLRRRLSEAID